MSNLNPYFGNNYNGQYVAPQQQQYFPNMGNGYNNPQIFGKIVDGYEVARATEVPMGISGVFLKADQSEVYVKSWNTNGTCPVTIYRPYIPTETKTEESAGNATLNALSEKIDALQSEVSKLTKQLG